MDPSITQYAKAAEATREVFARYDAQFQARSLDEALLDVTEHCRARQLTGEQVAQELRDAVRQHTQLTCSVGVAPNCMLAKVLRSSSNVDPKRARERAKTHWKSCHVKPFFHVLKGPCLTRPVIIRWPSVFNM